MNFNNESGLPEVIEKEMSGVRIGYALESWVDAGGLKWPTKFQNLGLPSEIVEYSDVAVGEPEDATYQPTVQ